MIKKTEFQLVLEKEILNTEWVIDTHAKTLKNPSLNPELSEVEVRTLLFANRNQLASLKRVLAAYLKENKNG